MNTLYAVSQELPVEIRPVSGKVKRRCAICLRPFTDGQGDVCADCWAVICVVHLPGWIEWSLHPELHRWTNCENVPECHEPMLCPLHTEAWTRAYQSTRTAWPIWAAAIGGNPNAPALDFKANYQYPDVIERIVQDARANPHVIPAEQWKAFGPDRPVFICVPTYGSPEPLPFVLAPVVREGPHVHCRMRGCPSEYIGDPSPKRYVCSHHTDAALRRARILKTDREDQEVHFDDPQYRFDYKTAVAARWTGSSAAYLGLGAYRESATAYLASQKSSCAIYAEDDNGRNDSDRGHSSSTSGVHRPYKSHPYGSAYAPIDPAKILGFRRSVWEKPIFPVQCSEQDFIWRVIHYPCNSKLVGKSLVRHVDPFLLSRSACVVPEHLKTQQVLMNSRFRNGTVKECVSEYPETAWVKCVKCGVEERFVLATAAPKEWLCGYCDPDKSKDDFKHRESSFFAARRGEEGEAIEDAIPTDTEAQERRLGEIIRRWQGRLKLAERRGQLNENPTRKEFFELLRKDKKLALDFEAEKNDFDAIDQGTKLPDKDATTYLRKLMSQIMNSSNPDAIHSDLRWEQLLKSGSKEAQQFHLGGIFLLVRRDRWRLYRLGPLDMPKVDPLGLPLNSVNLAFQKVIDKAITDARKEARRHKADEDEAAERAFEQFKTAEIIWVRASRTQKPTTN
jgi:hypothetical protein